jgi:hypothetical protein
MAEGAGGSTHGRAAFKVTKQVRSNLTKYGVRMLWTPRATCSLARRLASGMKLADALNVSGVNALAPDQRSKVLEGVA